LTPATRPFASTSTVVTVACVTTSSRPVSCAFGIVVTAVDPFALM
jgi:hypothetical protein